MVKKHSAHLPSKVTGFVSWLATYLYGVLDAKC